jgi:hypothetical protein
MGTRTFGEPYIAAKVYGFSDWEPVDNECDTWNSGATLKALVMSARRPEKADPLRKTSRSTSFAMLSIVPGLDSPNASLRSCRFAYASASRLTTALVVKKERASESFSERVAMLCKDGRGRRKRKRSWEWRWQWPQTGRAGEMSAGWSISVSMFLGALSSATPLALENFPAQRREAAGLGTGGPGKQGTPGQKGSPCGRRFLFCQLNIIAPYKARNTQKPLFPSPACYLQSSQRSLKALTVNCQSKNLPNTPR